MCFASLLQSLKSTSPRSRHARRFSRNRSAARPPCQRRRPEAECLEARTLLTVQFTPNSYVLPTNRPEVPLGTISGNFGGSPIEPMLVINHTDPGNIAVSSEEGVRLTTSAGAAFSRPVFFKPPSGASSGDDTGIQFDGQGRLFWCNRVGASGSGIAVSQIDPATGASIRSTLVTRGSNDDAPFMAIDTNPASPFFNNIYVVWSRIGGGTSQIFFSRSTDQAVTWSTPLQVSDPAVASTLFPSDVSVAPNGDVYVGYHLQPNLSPPRFRENPDGISGQTVVFRSMDGGVSFPQKSLAFNPGESDVTYNFQFANRTIPGTRFYTGGSGQPWVLADPVRPSNVYVVTADDPTNGVGAPYARISFVRSTDNGQTWNFPQPAGMMAPLDGDSFQLFPTAAIDSFGNIAVAWYDNRRGLTNRNGRYLLDVFATYSSDGGLSWAMPFQVNDAANPFDPDPSALTFNDGPPPTTWIGEHFSIAPFGGTVYLAWSGNTFSSAGKPVSQQVWFSSFALSGTLTVVGTPGDDSITIRSMADNTDFMEVLVNGRREYAGLWSALTGITVAATAGNDTVNIEDTAAGVPVTVNLGDGTDGVNLSPTAQNLSTIQGNVSINGQAGTTLTCYDQNNSAGQTYTITAATVARSGLALITYAGVGSLVLNGSSGGNTFTVQSTSSGTAMTLDGGAGGNTIVGSDAANTWSIIGRNAGTLTGAVILGPVTFSMLQNLTGGAGVDTFSFTDGQGVDGIIDGQAGTNALDYSAYIGNVIVNLQLSAATGVGGGIANIQDVTGSGGPGYSILVGKGGNVLRGGSGRNLLIAGAGASTVLGGTDQSILIGGSTSYDMMPDQLMAIMDYWAGTDDYDTRVFNLTHGIGVPLLDASTVTGNGGGNTLTGGPGRNLFCGNLALDHFDWDPLTETFIAV
jgi:hypothetical protein